MKQLNINIIHNKKLNIKRNLLFIILAIMAVTTIYPLLWLIISSFKNNIEIYTSAFSLPKKIAFENYFNAWQRARIGIYMGNSILVTLFSLIITLLLSSMTAYVLARIWKSSVLLIYFTLGIMVPLQAIVIPVFILLKTAGFLNTRYGLIIAYSISGLSLGIFILTGFMKSIPKELEESAIMEGCGYSQIFTKIILPLSRAPLSAVGILSFLQYWNEYLFASVLISKTEFKTLTQGLMLLRGQYTTDLGVLTAGLVIAVLPLIITYIILQEQIQEGVTAGAIKG